ncbi:MAG: helix-turn-helix transcriptional regulator [Firmicutes bacterium]|nr:helix-turn-helix transcriptional regulator [Bacillota bacterium]
MLYQRELDFLISIFKKCNMPIKTIFPGDLMSGIEDIFTQDFFSAVGEIKDRIFYKMTDAFGCNYMFFKIPYTDEEQILFIGPYITSEDPGKTVLEQAEEMNLEPQKAALLQKHYGDLLVLSEDSRLFASLDAFFDIIWGEKGFEYVNINMAEEPAFSYVSLLDDAFMEKEENWSVEMMEKRYAFENQLMDAVSKGQAYKAEMFLNAFSPSAFEQRLPDTLRNAKNYMIIMNTLLRKAAERGGVHPVYLDKMSSEFAREIESFNTVKIIPDFMKKIFEAYCRLVRKHATSNYSRLVRDVIIYIDSDLSIDLSLKKLAEINGVSASYLSTCFKKETGKNYADYVNSKRMSQAKHLLKTTRLQVQTVAQYCGFPDMQYFSKVFKKYTGYTPREYREIKQNRKNPDHQ